MSLLDRSRSDFVALATADEPVIVRAEATLSLDVDPLAAYATLAEENEYGFLLESAEKTAASDPDGAFEPAHTTGERHARYSFIGYDPDAVVTLEPDGDTVVPCRAGVDESLLEPGEGDVLDRLRSTLPSLERRGFPDIDRQLLDGGLVGFVAYDAVYDLWLEEVGKTRPETDVPDAEFVLNTRTVVFDHREGTVRLVFTPIIGASEDPETVYDALSEEAFRVREALSSAGPLETGGVEIESTTAGDRETYEAAVKRAKQAVHDGEVYQAVVSRTRQMAGSVDPLGLYAALRDENPSPYMYLLAHDDRTIVGSSPETLVSVAGDTVLNNPIAGTCPRGTSPVEDRRLAGEMLADEKERAEHTMLVDLARNDVRRVAEPGSVSVPEFMSVLKYSHVQHIESTVTGTLREDRDAFDAVRASFPAGTLSGAPKVRAMEYIHDLETSPRGVYGGGVGYVSWDGDAEFAIAIRTATIADASVERDGEASIRSEDGTNGDGPLPSEDRTTGNSPIDPGDGSIKPEGHSIIRVRAGAGIVADSDPAAEFEETEAKMDGVLAAIARIENPREPEVSR